MIADSLNDDDNLGLSQEIQDHLRQLAQQLGQPHDRDSIVQLWASVQALLSHLDADPLTLARVAGVLLVYQLPDTDRDEVKWFEAELSACQDVESVEELIDSLSRPDAL